MEHDDIQFLEKTIEISESLPPTSNPYLITDDEGFALNTSILCFDGQIKPIHSISVGDILMGDDNTPRTVISTQRIPCSSFFRIKQNRGSDYVINKNHIITLKLARIRKGNDININGTKYSKNDIVDIKLQDYMALNNTRKRDLKAIKSSVYFSSQPLKFNPYVFGLWVCDASDTNLSEIFINDIDILGSIISDLENDGIKLEFVRDNRFSISLTNTKNFIEEILTPLGISDAKFIPYSYKTNDTNTRLKILAGIIDCQGYLNSNCYELTIKNEIVANDIIFLCASLGLYASKAEQKQKSSFRIIISGDLSIIPTKVRHVTERKINKNILHTGITVESINETNECIKITLDGNGRFLLGDFTVAHS